MNHFHFPSAKASATIDFYERYFKFRKKRKLGKTQVLLGENGFLLAIDEEEKAHSMENKSHLGFALRDQTLVKMLYGQMLVEKVPMEGAIQAPSSKALHYYCFDPSGNRIEVGWYEI